ncbi:MAG: cell division topological specificity factor MinE [Firmicutes bacterium]|nr:cell division topological specificity factor MinE [Bacillota bacterium]MDY5676882.1 cell division topological specificity factor MinE [Eubacteriales bacterium]
MREIVGLENRLKNMIALDKKEEPEKIIKVLKAEVVNLLKNYFEITSEDVETSILVNSDGKYDLQINAVSNTIKIANTFSN